MGGLVEDQLAALDRRADGRDLVTDLGLDELGLGIDVVAVPVERSSSTRTSSPRARRASTRCEPMKPAPPVTRQRIAGLSSRNDQVGRMAYCGAGISILDRLLPKEGHERVGR